MQLNALILGIMILQLSQAFEENSKFCIRSDPMLFDDIEKHENPTAGDPRCEILATALTIKEKETLYKTMCKDYGSTRKEGYHFFQLHNGNLKGRRNHQDICDGKRNLYFAWIPYRMMQSHFAAELNPKERVSYIAKATDIEREKTELCHFRHVDLATNITDNLFTCIVMVFEDNFYGLEANIHVLVEILPLMYELRNVTYLPWTNVTTSYKTQLGKATLKNQSPEYKQIYGSISYAYVEKMKLNTSSVYGQKLDHLPILFSHKGATIELDNAGIGGVKIKERVYFGRNMDPKTSVNVELIGQWAEHQQQFNGDIYEYFGYGIRRFREEMSKGEACFIRIQSTEAVYQMPESSHLTEATVHSSARYHKFARLLAGNETDNNSTDTDTTTDDDLDWEAEMFDVPPNDGRHHRDWYPWSVFGGIILGIVLIAAIMALVRTCSKEKDTHRYTVAENA